MRNLKILIGQHLIWNPQEPARTMNQFTNQVKTASDSPLPYNQNLTRKEREIRTGNKRPPKRQRRRNKPSNISHEPDNRSDGPYIRDQILLSPSFLVSLLIAMLATSNEQAATINAHLNLLPNCGEFKDFDSKHTAKLKSKTNTNTIKVHIIGPENALIERVNMTMAQKTLLNRKSNRIYKLEAKIEQMEQGLNENIDAKIEEALHNLFKTMKTSNRKSKPRSNHYSNPKTLRTDSDRTLSETRTSIPKSRP